MREQLVGRRASKHKHTRRGRRGLNPADDVQLLGGRRRRRLLLERGSAPAENTSSVM